MKTFCTAFAIMAALGLQPALAYEDIFARKPAPEKEQLKQGAQQQGKDSSRTRQRGRQQGQANSQNSQTRPWEVRPWEQGKEESQTKPWEARPWDPQQKATEERRRVGRKARKEQAERRNAQAQEIDSQERVRQRPSKWQRHQMDSQRYNPTPVR